VDEKKHWKEWESKAELLPILTCGETLEQEIGPEVELRWAQGVKRQVGRRVLG